MSFGFGVGDIVKAIELCNKLRRDFADAPRQFQEIRSEVRSLSIVLQDVEVYVSDGSLTDKEQHELLDIGRGCHGALHNLANIIRDNLVLSEHGRNSVLRAKIAWKRMRWDPEEVQKIRGSISSNVSLLNAFYHRTTKESTTRIVQHIEDEELRQALDWLTPVDYGLQQSDYISRRQPDTGLWLLESPEFCGWLDRPGLTMFCPGIPGAGKTIMTSTVVDHFLSHPDLGNDVGIAYIYFNFRREDDQSVVLLLSSLIKQFIRQQPKSSAEDLKRLHSAHRSNGSRPSIAELRNLLHVTTASPLFQRIFVLLDALDECQSARNTRVSFMAQIFALQQSTCANIFATSRFIPDIEQLFQPDSISLEIRASDGDVQRYLEANLDSLPGCVRRSTALQTEIKSTISAAVDGMFLLAQIYISSLDDKLTAKAIRLALGFFRKQGALSKGAEEGKLTILSQAYDQAMERIWKQKTGFRQLAEKALAWVIHAMSPLTTAELTSALAIEDGEPTVDESNIPEIEDVVAVCAGLLTVDQESKIVRLVHYTAQEYFERTRLRWFPAAHDEIALGCIAYFSTFATFQRALPREDDWWPEHGVPDTVAETTTGPDKLPKKEAWPLLTYSRERFGDHLRAANYLVQNSPRVIDFFQREDLMECWCHNRLGHPLHFILDFPLTMGMSGLHIAAYFGVLETVNHWLASLEDIPWDVDSHDQDGRTPIFYAIYSGHYDVVEALLRANATVEFETKQGYTPLAFAARFGNAAITRLLTDRGAHPNHVSIVPSGLSTHRETPLNVAADVGNLEIVTHLLDCGADVEFENNEGETAVFLGASRGHHEVVGVLLTRGSDVDSPDKSLVTPLMVACVYGTLETVQVLLRAGADVEAVNNEGRTALFYCVRAQGKPFMLALIDAGARLGGDDCRGLGLLQLAAQKGHGDIVQLLLSIGMNVEANRLFAHRFVRFRDVRDSDMTPLLSAAQCGHFSTVEILLSHGARLEAKDEHGRTPLMLAVKSLHVRTVALLLEKGADVQAKDKHGQDIFSMAWISVSDSSTAEALQSVTVAMRDIPTRDILLKLFTRKSPVISSYPSYPGWSVSSDSLSGSSLSEEGLIREGSEAGEPADA